MNVRTIHSQELLQMHRSGEQIDLIDVRTPVEFRELHARGARLIPLDRLDPSAVMAGRNGRHAEPVYVICRSGSRAKQACERFISAGFDNVVAVEGGTLAWEQAGGPVERGWKAISLEGQVRIAAGGVVLAGSLLALTVSSWFALLPAFVGAGLVFAGITDRCGMAVLLGRMPWNQVQSETACTAR
jgi:rhodanese-related sulfurtransferase